MVTHGLIAAILTEAALADFNPLVRRDGIMQDVINPVPRAPPEPGQQLSLLF
jgi:hypothetical protein